MVIESVPNVSEGSRLQIVDALATAVRSTPGVMLLDHSADAAHNRSVFTLAGPPPAVEEAVLKLYAHAVAAIDMRTHRGVHPRIGALDVVPFIPLAGATLEDCVDLARRVGARVAATLHVPVYLYEAAATTPARRKLEDVRRGQFEGLAAKMARPEWAPDFGPALPHPTAGATVIGARHPLIAFNVNLSTDRLDVAARVAATVRQSSGGMPAVKAIGVPLTDRGLVQVSLNLTNYEVTPIEQLFAAVKAEAARHGVEVLESELIGLIPQAALAGTTPAALMLTNFSPDRILESRLARISEDK
ncbi:MAG: glutamate formimidoyltransferase [Luteitalea sp.]|nr:glutamate formimidoyltransferase [Luteitalea sp.]